MALKIKLRPKESILVNGALIENGPTATELTILNRVPLLREKEILREADAKSACERIYFLVQCLYFDTSNSEQHFRLFSKLAMEVIKAAPSTAPFLDRIHSLMRDSEYYNALKEVRKLIAYERELIAKAKARSDRRDP